MTAKSKPVIYVRRIKGPLASWLNWHGLYWFARCDVCRGTMLGLNWERSARTMGSAMTQANTHARSSAHLVSLITAGFAAKIEAGHR